MGTCYGAPSSMTEVKDYITVNGRDIGGAGIDNKALRVASKVVNTPIVLMSHYLGSSCIVESSNPYSTNSYLTFESYNPMPASYPTPLDIKPK
ncbi:MAG: hypothetical protein EOP04_29725 [Proteobacteria bacterium]|nr:MAG: hypothetical protein EOP04_29725 [Pseudomonadota bacterium]